MPRFSVGTQVRTIGAIAENYLHATGIVLEVRPDARSLPHLNKYRVLLSDQIEETFFEFQLAAAKTAEDGEPEREATA